MKLAEGEAGLKMWKPLLRRVDYPLLVQYIVGHDFQSATKRCITHPLEATHPIIYRNQNTLSYGTLLYWACANGAPLKVIQALINAWPGVDMHESWNGSNLLHCALQRADCVEVAMTLLAWMPGLVNVETKGFMDILTFLCGDPESRAHLYNLKEKAEEGELNALDDLKTVKFVEIIVKTILSNEADDQSSRALGVYPQQMPLLHACLSSEYVIHIDLIPLLCLAVHPKQAAMRNARGDMPIHLVIKSHLQNDEERIQLLEEIIWACPMCVLQADASGRFPIILAIHDTPSSEETIDLLLDSSLPALTTRDTTTGLFPFMLAASKGCTLTSIFGLLRACPEVERFMCQGKGQGSMQAKRKCFHDASKVSRFRLKHA